MFRDGDTVELGSRNERPLTRYFPEVVEAVKESLPRRGASSTARSWWRIDDHLEFERLLDRIHPADSRVRMLAEQTPASFVAFDLLAFDDHDLTASGRSPSGASCWRRRCRARRAPVHLTALTRSEETANEWLATFEGAGLDGVVAKPLAAPYSPGQRTMLKIKHERTADVVVAGYRLHKTSTPEQPLLGSMLLGLYDDEGTLQHVGRRAPRSAPRAGPSWSRSCGRWRPTRPTTRGDWGAEEGDAETGRRRPGSTSRWNAGKDLSFVALRPERVLEVAYDHMQGTRFRHTTQFRRWRPDRDPESCRYDQLEQVVSYDLVRGAERLTRPGGHAPRVGCPPVYDVVLLIEQELSELDAQQVHRPARGRLGRAGALPGAAPGRGRVGARARRAGVDRPLRDDPAGRQPDPGHPGPARRRAGGRGAGRAGAQPRAAAAPAGTRPTASSPRRARWRALVRAAAGCDAAEAIVLTAPHAVREFLHVDWTSKARRVPRHPAACTCSSTRPSTSRPAVARASAAPEPARGSQPGDPGLTSAGPVLRRWVPTSTGRARVQHRRRDRLAPRTQDERDTAWRCGPEAPYPLGASYDGAGTNFALFSEVAEAVELCLFDDDGTETRVPLPERDALVWHAYLPRVGPGRRYGFRVHGPYEPDAGPALRPQQAAARPVRQGHRGRDRLGQRVLLLRLQGPHQAQHRGLRPAHHEVGGHQPLLRLAGRPATAPPVQRDRDLRGARAGPHHDPPGHPRRDPRHLRGAGAPGDRRSTWSTSASPRSS